MSALKLFQKNNDLYEDMVSAIITKAPSADVLVDAGAHVGRHTETMLGRHDTTAVYAVEAIPALAKLISGKPWVDDRLKLHNCALGSKEGSTSFYVANNAMGYSGLAQREQIPGIEWIEIQVEMLKLDQIIPSQLQSRVGLIKLDLEGGEFDAIRGAAKTISDSRPLIVFENSLDEAAQQYSYNCDDFFGFFNNLEYHVVDFFGSRVDRSYWSEVLQTYMFIAYPRHSTTENWWESKRSELLQTVINSRG